MMRCLLTILLLFISIGVFAQKVGTKALDKAVVEFDKALLNSDSVSLNRLLSNDVSYGHSNGWIQTKKDVVQDLFSGKLNYKSISPADEQIKIEGNTASVRMNIAVDIVMEGKPLTLKLKVLQVWIWKNKHWELFARQSVKI